MAQGRVKWYESLYRSDISGYKIVTSVSYTKTVGPITSSQVKYKFKPHILILIVYNLKTV
jgi:hypothetical protein